MYVPPISGSAIWVWKAVIPTNWTVLDVIRPYIRNCSSPLYRAHLVNDDNRVVKITIPK